MALGSLLGSLLAWCVGVALAQKVIMWPQHATTRLRHSGEQIRTSWKLTVIQQRKNLVDIAILHRCAKAASN